jgi:hypothetical protein
MPVLLRRCCIVRVAARSLLTLVLSLGAGTANAQLIPAPRDGDIRVVYWDLRSETQVFLTLELKSPEGEKFPVSLTFSVTFPGKRPAVPPTQVDVRAYVGTLWAPEPQLTLVLDGRDAVEFAPPGPVGMYQSDPDSGSTLVGIVGTIPMATLKQMSSARSVAGNVLRLKFELVRSQQDAIARFAERVVSPDPGQLSGLR